MRTEGGVNLQAMIVPLQTDRLRVRFFGGPTYFRVTQDAVTDIRYNQVFVFLGAVNNITITVFDREEIEEQRLGLPRRRRRLGLLQPHHRRRRLARFSRQLDLENTSAAQ